MKVVRSQGAHTPDYHTAAEQDVKCPGEMVGEDHIALECNPEP